MSCVYRIFRLNYTLVFDFLENAWFVLKSQFLFYIPPVLTIIYCSVLIISVEKLTRVVFSIKCTKYPCCFITFSLTLTNVTMMKHVSFQTLINKARIRYNVSLWICLNIQELDREDNVQLSTQYGESVHCMGQA